MRNRTPRTPRDPDKPPHVHKPASGIPAGGTGWGGQAKGASTSRIKPGDLDGIQAMSHDSTIKARNDAWRESVLLMYAGYVDDGQAPPMIRIAAGDKLLDRIDGKPVATQITAVMDEFDTLTDEQLHARAARLRARLIADGSGDRSEGGEEPA